MNWENIGKISVAVVCACAVVGIIYLIIRIVLWKWHIDSKIELQDDLNKEIFQALEDIKATVGGAISEKGSKK